LEEVELDHDGLEFIYLVSNNLTELDLSKVLNLKSLWISDNDISDLKTDKYYKTRRVEAFIGLEQLTKLEDLRCNKNVLI
jgi:Leucine-rich repeat (LRR) protein